MIWNYIRRCSRWWEVDNGIEVDDGDTDLPDDDNIIMHVEKIEVVYASEALGLSEVDGAAIEVHKKVDNRENADVEEASGDDEDDYDYDFWNDFVLRNCEWNDEKDEDGRAGVGQRGGHTTKENGGVRGEMGSKMSGGGCDPSSSKGSVSAANKQHNESMVCSATVKSTLRLEDYIDDGRDYIGTLRSGLGFIDEESYHSGMK